MRLTTRDDPEQGRIHVIEWSPDSQSDLVGVLFLTAAAAVCTGCALGCFEVRGVFQIVLIVFAILSGLFFASLAIPLLAICWGIYVINGVLLAEAPTRRAWLSLVLAAAALGAIVGTDVYEVGVIGLFSGPAIVTIALIVRSKFVATSSRGRGITLSVGVSSSLAAALVGSTIFL